MKKLIGIVLILLMCFCTLAACGTDTKALEERIAQLEQELNDARANGLKGDKGDKGDIGPQGPVGPAAGVTNTIYKLGDEVTISQNGYDLFKIKYVERTVTGMPMFSFTNINMPRSPISSIISVFVWNISRTSVFAPSPPSSSSVSTWSFPVFPDDNLAYFCLAGTFATVAIFEL